MLLPILLLLQLQAPLRAVADTGMAVNNMRVTPAGVQSVFDGRVHSVRFGAKAGELWVAVPGNAWRLAWQDNRVVARAEFNGRPGVHGIAIDPVTGRASVSSVGRLPADVAASRMPGGPPLSRAKSVTQLVTYGDDSLAKPIAESGGIGAFMAGAPAIARTANSTGKRVAIVPLPADDALALIDAATGKLIRSIELGVLPIAAVIADDGSVAWVTVFGGPKPKLGARSATQCCDPSAEPVRVNARGIAEPGTVVRVDLVSGAVTHTVTVGLHPTGLAWDRARGRLYIANGNSDNISVVSTRTNKLLGTIAVTPFRERRIGLAPTAVALSPDGNTLFATLGGVNAVALYDVSKPTTESQGMLRGLIPTGWYPSSVDASSDGRTVAVGTLFGVGAGTGRTGGLTGRYVFAERGSVNVIQVPTDAELAAYTTAVAENNRLHLGGSAYAAPVARSGVIARAVPERPGETSLIQHVVYIIKENRTYDQVLGDIGKGASDPSLTMYGRDVTPNTHALSEQFVLLDHFFASGGNSADGHNWLTQANETAYPIWPLYLGRSYPSEGNDPLAYSSGGFIWEAAASKGKRVVSFGEYAPAPKQSKAVTRQMLMNFFRDSVHDSAKSRARLRGMYNTRSEIPSLDRILVREYPGWTQEVPDVVKADILAEHLKEWEAAGKMPELTLMILPNDHTEGTSAGWCTPKACVADNDFGMGRIVESLSHSSFWKSMAILVVEDDAQNGVDHIDGHRTVAMVASPYARRGVIDSTFYSQPSMVKTIELMLGLPALSMFDLVATDMRASFIGPNEKPDFTPYTALAPQQSLYDVNVKAGAMNGPAVTEQKKAAVASARMNFREPDAAPTDMLNRILWQDAKGWGKPYPVVKQSLFFPLAVDVDDDDREEDDGDGDALSQGRHVEFSVGAVALSADHYLLANTLLGADAMIKVAFPRQRIGVRLGVEHVRGHADRSGSTCSGLIPPGVLCAAQPLRDQAQITELLAGVELTLLRVDRFTLGATADVRSAVIDVTTRSLTTVDKLSASKVSRGIVPGVQVGWRPFPARTLTVNASASAGKIGPVREEMLIDGYSPFERRISMKRIRLGVEWTPDFH